ncbi:MAG: CRTAC1 family protein, partial [Candidatus Poribacteria bacterium]
MKLKMVILIIFMMVSINMISLSITTFTDITEDAGVGYEGKSFSAASFDYNKDGNLDLIIANGDGPNVLYKKNDDGTFDNVAAAAGVDDNNIGKGTWAGTSAVFGDYDNDGDLDVYVTIDVMPIDPDAILPAFNVLYSNNGDGTFTDVTQEAGVGANENGSVGAVWADYNNDNYLDLYIVNLGINNILYKNNGDGTFTDVTAAAGVEGGIDAASSGLGAVFFDADNDGDQDLYVVNGFGPPCFLYLNNGDGTFKDIAQKAHVEQPGDPNGGVAVGDYDNDGDMDIYVVNYFMPNVLYQNRGDGTFEDVAKEAGVDFEAPGMSASFADFDNDGYLDIYVVNKGPNVLYRNNGDGTFTDITEKAGVKAELGSSVATIGDYNNDGFIDIYVANSGPAGSKKGEPNIMYRNNGNGNNWLYVNVIREKGHIDAIGSKVKVIAGDLMQTAIVSGGQGIVQNSLMLEFGLGDADYVDVVEVTYPDGTVQSLKTPIEPNQTLTVTEEGFTDFTPSNVTIKGKQL